MQDAFIEYFGARMMESITQVGGKRASGARAALSPRVLDCAQLGQWSLPNELSRPRQ